MVLLQMTPTVAAAAKLYLEHSKYEQHPGDPSIDAPESGNPISHGQLIEISKYIKANPETAKGKGIGGKDVPIYLNELMRGCSMYTPPPKPKAEQTSEYKTLMAGLRREEEARSYSKMLNSVPPQENLNTRFPTSSYGHLFPPASEEDEETTYADINRQMALIANVLISIIACSIAIWKVAWHWNTPARLALSMTGSIVVAVAEVAIYAGYIGRVGEAKMKERRKVERKVVESSWVIEGSGGGKGSRKRGTVTEMPVSGLRLRAKSSGKL